MSFAFMPVYTGDYLRDTQHLSCSEHGIYFKLLMHCWDQKGPAPLDERKLCGIVNARSADEFEALRRILGEFFTRMDDGWYNNRMDREIQRAAALSERLSTAGKMGARKRKSLLRQGVLAKAEPRLNQGSSKAKPLPHTPTPTLTPTTTPTPKKKPPSSPPFALPDWVPVDAWAAWEEMRVKRRKPLTDAARAVNLRKLERLRSENNAPLAVIENAVAHGWDSFYPLKPGDIPREDMPGTFEHANKHGI